MVAAAFLHDIAHLFNDDRELTDWERDRDHAGTAAEWASSSWPPNVTTPIALHVEAKRYLCSTEPDYLGRLDQRSQASLRNQGGAMSKSETQRFLTQPDCQDALRLRYWDDSPMSPRFEPSQKLMKFVMGALRATARKSQ